MTKKWKIIWSVVAAIAVIGVVVIGAAVYFGGKFVEGMQIVAQDIYGGPLPSTVIPVMGLDIKSSNMKMATYSDVGTGLAVVILTTPPSEEKTPPFSEPDIKKALSGFGSELQSSVQSSLQGASEGSLSALKLGNHTINTIKYNNKGQLSEVGVLNLDKGRMLFIAISADSQSDPENEKIVMFLSNMPVIKNDSHMRADSQKPTAVKEQKQ